MGHTINGFIGRADELTAAARTLQHAHVCPLNLGFAFVPLTEEVASLDDRATHHEELIRLTEPMTDWAREQSERFPIVYVETDYFGGTGSQSAIVWQGGSVVYGPTRTDNLVPLLDGAVNSAVRKLGAVCGTSVDEFAALGLDRYRENEDWIAAVGKLVA